MQWAKKWRTVDFFDCLLFTDCTIEFGDMKGWWIHYLNFTKTGLCSDWEDDIDKYYFIVICIKSKYLADKNLMFNKSFHFFIMEHLFN